MAFASSTLNITVMSMSSSMADQHNRNQSQPQKVLNSSLTPVPLPDEINDLHSRLKSKRAVQLKDSSIGEGGGKAASILSTPEVSNTMRLLFGEDKKELKVETRTQLKRLEEITKDAVKYSPVNNGSKAVETLQELVFTPEHVVFNQILANEPVNWSTRAIATLAKNKQKEKVKEQIIKDIEMVRERRRELLKNTSIAKKELEELTNLRRKRMDRMSQDSVRRLQIAHDSYKAEADKLQEDQKKRGGFASLTEVQDLVEKFEKLREQNEALTGEFAKLSANGAIPADLVKAMMITDEKKHYLESLKEQIANPFDLSRSIEDSVFRPASSLENTPK